MRVLYKAQKFYGLIHLKKNPLKNIWKNSKEVCSLQMMLSFFDHYHYYHHDLVFVEIYCYPFALKSTDRHNDDFSLW